MKCGIVEKIAMDTPEELRLRIGARAQPGEHLGRRLELEDRADFVADLARRRHIIRLACIEHEDVLADLAEETRAGLLAERALGDQRLDHGWRLEVAVPGVVGESVVHGLDHMTHRVQADHIGGAVGRALRMADGRTGQRIDDIEAEFELVGVVHRRQHRENADAIADEVRRVAER